MLFGIVSGVGQGMGVLDGGGNRRSGNRRRGRGSFVMGEFGPPHCNKWGLCCIVEWKCVNRSSCRLG